MGLPFSVPADDHPSLPRNLTLDATAWVGFGITSALIGTLLPAVARREGMDALGLALLAVIPFAALFVSIFAGRIGPRGPLGLALLRTVGALSLALVLVGPGITWIVLASGIYWVANMLGTPLQQRLWGVMYPAESRGRLLGIVATGRYSAGAVALLAAGILAAYLDGVAVVAVGGLLGTALALATGGLRTREADGPTTFSVREAVRSVIHVPSLRRLTVAHSFVGGGLNAATPLVTLVLVDRLGLGIDQIGVVGMVGALATVGSLFAWGTVADRWGGLAVIVMAGLTGIGGLAFYAAAPSFAVVLVAAFLVGLSIGAIEVSLPLLINTYAPDAREASAAAGTNAIFGLRGMVVPVAAVLLVQLGILDVAGTLLACMAAAVVGTLLYLRVPSGNRAVARARGALGALAHRRGERSREVPTGQPTAAGMPVPAASEPRFAVLR